MDVDIINSIGGITMHTIKLTPSQIQFLSQLGNKYKCPFLAGAIETHWSKGENYYIDSRVSVPKKVRKEFEELQPCK